MKKILSLAVCIIVLLSAYNLANSYVDYPGNWKGPNGRTERAGTHVETIWHSENSVTIVCNSEGVQCWKILENGTLRIWELFAPPVDPSGDVLTDESAGGGG